MANIRVKDLPNTSAPAADTDEFIIDSSSAGTRRLNYGELKTAISGDFQSGTSTYKVATLGSDNKLDPAQIPDTLSQGLNFVGVANSAGDLTSTTQGDFYVIQTAFGVYSVGDQAVYDGSAYIRVTDGTKQISEGGTGATTLDDAKGNLEIPDIGTAPNQTPLSGQLGSMAWQSAEGISVGAATIDGDAEIGATSSDHTRLTISSPNNKDGQVAFDDSDGSLRGFVIYDHAQEKLKIGSGGANAVYVDSSQRVGIQDANPSPADSLTVTSDNASTSLPLSTMMVRNNSNTTGSCAGIAFQARNSAADVCGAFVGAVSQSTYRTADLAIHTRYNGTYAERLRITNSALVLGSGMAIDFGAVASGTGTVTPTTGGLLDDYETGSWTGTYVPQTGTFTTMTMDTDLVYTKVGNLVHISGFIRTDDVDITGGSNGTKITGLPFTCAKPSAVSIGFAWNWGTYAPLAGYIGASGDAIWLQTRSSTTSRTDGFSVTNMSTGTSPDRNILYLEATYQTS